MDKRLKAMICSVFLILGLVFAFGVPAIIGAVTGKCTLEVQATVADMVVKDDGDGTMYSAVYEYVVNGEEFRVTSNASTSWQPKIGETKTIKVDPDDPENMTDPQVMGFIVKIFRGVGYAFLGVFLILLIFVRSKKIIGY